ncbi:MAG: PEP-CTERM sorting domain-containing protein [Rubritalea sp.]
MKKIIILLLVSGTLANAVITVAGGLVTNLADENNTELSAPTTFAVLVALNNDSFDGLVMSDTISIGETVGEGKYFVLQTETTIDVSINGFGEAGQVDIANYNIVGTPLAGAGGGAAAGNNVAFVWFPGLVGSSLTTVDFYGAVSNVDWILPADGGTLTFTNITGSPQQANFTIQPIPEPSSIALLGLGAFGLLMRRRRD